MFLFTYLFTSYNNVLWMFWYWFLAKNLTNFDTPKKNSITELALVKISVHDRTNQVIKMLFFLPADANIWPFLIQNVFVRPYIVSCQNVCTIWKVVIHTYDSFSTLSTLKQFMRYTIHDYKNLTVTTNRIILFIRKNSKCACSSVQINEIMQTLPRNHKNLP